MLQRRSTSKDAVGDHDGDAKTQAELALLWQSLLGGIRQEAFHNAGTAEVGALQRG
jgi:hypothetical protein